MGLKECNIVLDNPWNTYYAGQTINGRVDFVFDAPKTVRGIVIRFLGESNTKWDETKSVVDAADGKSRDETEVLTGHEEYFQIQYYLLGGKNNAETVIQPGTSSYPFTCALPPTLPSSFEGEWGHVRYTIKVTLDRPWKFDQDTKMAFTIISPVDLNLNPRVQDPFKLELEKSFCCLCCASGPLSIIASVPVTGYVSGQIIPIVVECDNASNVRINAMKLTLKKVVAFHVQTPRRVTKKDKITIAEINIGGVDAHGSQLWQKQIEIPPLPPSNLQNCSLIDLDYELQVQGDVDGLHSNLDGIIPITLGTIPLASFQAPTPYTDVPMQDPSMLPTQPVSPATPAGNGQAGGALGWSMADSGGNNLYPDIPVPTFAESQYKAPISDRNDTQYTQFANNGDYAPRYPTYSFNPTAPTGN